MLPEWTEDELLERTANVAAKKDVRFVYFYTPLCGTCKVGIRMLEVVVAMHPDIPVGLCNINYAQALAQGWRIESVPCLVKLEGGTPSALLYRLGTVQELRFWMLDESSKTTEQL
ncbi:MULTISPECIES: thioredoxin family protein [unclassified Paenibacillus]|uniref:thioredoxin family protein n=1 Tax=unclassified Paenibacillus TaxID=185978 RepID=UPI001AE25B99|nr:MULTISPECIES: thioredoxin family protein [unclassified Paenibacillus]MBP1155504.1 thiol-disulfide isomerase/thioredoxin [Paenibacillus sp. PvP091]MBP1169110.1 thiol-disulfide isomerase/thioredoxin [Paenibacillus sp. PvR098]MBP2440138.1 thiol-disulfide isomerase/thioredoxin [Paenibacillus sp. PvP052]